MEAGYSHETEAKGHNDADSFPAVHIQAPDRLDREQKDQEIRDNSEAVIGNVHVAHGGEFLFGGITPQPPLADWADDGEITHKAAQETCKCDAGCHVYRDCHWAVVPREDAVV
jgi:hypothetical protein